MCRPMVAVFPRKPRIFDTDGDHPSTPPKPGAAEYQFFFGTGGYAIWASDNTTRKVAGITISSGLGSDISKCLDMTNNDR